MKKKILIALAILFLLIAAFLLYVYFNLNSLIASFKPQIESLASETLAVPVHIAKIEAEVFPHAKLVLSGFDLGQSGGSKESLSLQEVELSVRLLPLISGRIEVVKLTVDTPKI